VFIRGYFYKMRYINLRFTYLLTSSSSCWGDLFNKPQGSVVSNWIAMKLSTIVPPVNMQLCIE